jgi:hypothetical protein
MAIPFPYKRAAEKQIAEQCSGNMISLLGLHNKLHQQNVSVTEYLTDTTMAAYSKTKVSHTIKTSVCKCFSQKGTGLKTSLLLRKHDDTSVFDYVYEQHKIKLQEHTLPAPLPIVFSEYCIK